MRALVLFGLFCIFPALFCYRPETAEEVAKDDDDGLVDIAGKAEIEVEARDPGLDFYNDALDTLLRLTRHCPYCNGCRCYSRSCFCRKRGVTVYLTFSNPSCCGPTLAATFRTSGFTFRKHFRATNGCHNACKSYYGRTYCFKFCINNHGNAISGRINQVQPYHVYIGKFKFNL